MRLTNKNHKELRVLKHYTPQMLRDVEIDDESATLYFDWSDRGIGKALIETRIAHESRSKRFTGLSALYYSKRYRDLAITSYLADWGDTLLVWDFEDEPREIAEFVAKAMNKPSIMEVWREKNES